MLFLNRVLWRDARAIIDDGRDWYVEITNEKLTWFSPIPEQMESFEARLSDIAAVHQVKIRG